jgi:beta-ureidopropionase / N-carbamoyl-L-amino-acid hydrolase
MLKSTIMSGSAAASRLRGIGSKHTPTIQDNVDPMTLTLETLNSAPRSDALQLLDGLYEHSPWIAEKALDARPFRSLAHLKYEMTQIVERAGKDRQLTLIRAHPELAGKAMVSDDLTAESTNEQSRAGLTHCTAEEFARLQQLNGDYNAKFGFPFILAVRGPRGSGLNKQQIIATFARRLQNHPDFELQECLRNIHRVVELRLNDKFAAEPTLGHEVWDWHETLAQFSDPEYREKNQLTVTYLTDAHRACAAMLVGTMKDCGFDDVHIDAVGNVIGVYRANSHPSPPPAGEGVKTLLTGSHFDTVRNGGKYDGRLGIFVPMACVRELHRQGKRLPFSIEVVGFAEEEGQRYKATFLGSGALVGDFKPEWLAQQDANGVSMREAMRHAGLPATLEAINALARQPDDYLGFVEVHIEQGPILNARHLPLGVVTSINGSVRYLGEVIGMASHAGTTPMTTRRDAATAVAEIALYLEKRGGAVDDLVATMGLLAVPGGSINVVPGRCQFSLDIRATSNAVRDACAQDVFSEIKRICERRGVAYTLEETLRVAAAPSAPDWQARWEKAVDACGLPVFRMPSGAGHDAMKLHEVMPQAMLFVRGENAGISHNPLESSTSDDIALAIEAFNHLLTTLATQP